MASETTPKIYQNGTLAGGQYESMLCGSSTLTTTQGYVLLRTLCRTFQPDEDDYARVPKLFKSGSSLALTTSISES